MSPCDLSLSHILSISAPAQRRRNGINESTTEQEISAIYANANAALACFLALDEQKAAVALERTRELTQTVVVLLGKQMHVQVSQKVAGEFREGMLVWDLQNCFIHSTVLFLNFCRIGRGHAHGGQQFADRRSELDGKFFLQFFSNACRLVYNSEMDVESQFAGFPTKIDVQRGPSLGFVLELWDFLEGVVVDGDLGEPNALKILQGCALVHERQLHRIVLFVVRRWLPVELV